MELIIYLLDCKELQHRESATNLVQLYPISEYMNKDRTEHFT